MEVQFTEEDLKRIGDPKILEKIRRLLNLIEETLEKNKHLLTQLQQVKKELSQLKKQSPQPEFKHTSTRALLSAYEHTARLFNPSLLIGDIAPQLAENLPLPLHTAETAEPVGALMEYLIPSDLRGHFLDTVAAWSPGDRKGAIITVGSTKNGSSHPHLFEVARTDTGALLTFADPENTVADRSTFKPSVMVMLQTHIADDSNLSTQLSYIRFRDRSLTQHERHMPAQLAAARELLVTDGIPTMIADHPESILWELHLGGDINRIQSCMATAGQLKRVLRGESPPVLLDKRLATVRGTHTLFPHVLEAEDHAIRAYEHVAARAATLEKAAQKGVYLRNEAKIN